MFKISKIYLIFIILLFACSFDHKSGIWTKHKIKEQDALRTLKTIKLFPGKNLTQFQEVVSDKKISIDIPKINSSWMMPGMNNTNLIGNLKFDGDLNFFFKRKIGKNKKNFLNTYSSPIYFQENILFSDSNGTLFSLTDDGSLIWRNNIYQKKDKKIYKKISYLFYKGNIYCADNIGNLYSLNSESGKIQWIRNYGKFFNSKIKIINDEIVLIDQDDSFLLLNPDNGDIIWNLASQVSLFKSSFLNSVASSGDNSVVYSTSSGNIINVNIKYKTILWTSSFIKPLKGETSDFLKNADLVTENNILYYSNNYKTLAVELVTGKIIWEHNFGTYISPVLSGRYMFLLNGEGKILCLDKYVGTIVWSTDLFKGFKSRKVKKMNTTGLIMGSGNLYSTTNNGYIIVVSAENGKIKKSIKISDSFLTNLIISQNKLFALTGSSRLLLFK